MLAAVKLQEVGVTVAINVAADQQGHERSDKACRIGTNLRRAHDFNNEVWRVENKARQMALSDFAQIGVAHHDRSKAVGLQLVQQIHALSAAQVIEAVAVLQQLHLRLKDKVEGCAQHAAELLLLFGQATDPKIDGVQAALPRRPGSRAVEVVHAVQRRAGTAKYQQHRRVTTLFVIGRGQNCFMRAVGGNEVDDRQRVLHVRGEVEPAGIGRQARVARHREELCAGFIKRRHASFAASGDVERGQIQRQADQVVAQRFDHELVDFIAHLPRHTANDLTRSHCSRDGAVLVEFDRVQEGTDQPDLLCVGRQGVGIDDLVGRGQAVHRLGQHRVAEAIHHMGKFGDDGRVEVGRGRKHEGVDGGLHLAGELLEYQMLVLHFGDEAGGLEEALAVPVQRGDTGGVGQSRDLRHAGQIGGQPFVDDGQVAAGEDRQLVVFDQAVVFSVEDRVNGGQADIFVAASVAGDEVAVEQLVVISAVRLG